MRNKCEANVFRGRKRFVSEGDGGKVKPWVCHEY